jgi:hypothetical protein
MIKFSSTTEINTFKTLLNGGKKEEVISKEKEKLINYYDPFCPYFTNRAKTAEEYAEITIKYELPCIDEVEEFFKTIKIYEEKQTYRVNPWGYDQTNYENFTIIGERKGCIVCLGRNDIWVVAKNKFAKKEYTRLDQVVSTNWEPAYTAKEISDKEDYNAYNGH